MGCDFDLHAINGALAEGTLLWHVCAQTCNRCDEFNAMVGKLMANAGVEVPAEMATEAPTEVIQTERRVVHIGIQPSNSLFLLLFL